MGRMKAFEVFLGIILCVFLSGCSQVQKKEPKETTKQQPQSVMISTATRTIPETCKAGDIIEVKINIVPANQVSGIIVKEKIPESWSIIKSEPQFTKIEPANTYKWLQWGKQVLPFTIVYQLKIPEKAKGKYSFEGTITTYREGEIPFTGNSVIEVK